MILFQMKRLFRFLSLQLMTFTAMLLVQNPVALTARFRRRHPAYECFNGLTNRTRHDQFPCIKPMNYFQKLTWVNFFWMNADQEK